MSTTEQEPGCPLQDLLPPELREAMAALLPLPDRLSWRRCSRRMRDAFDASCTAMTIGTEVGGDAIAGLVRRMPRLASLEVAHWWPAVDWHAVLSVSPGGGGLHTLRVGLLDRGRHGVQKAPPPPPGMLRTVGEARGAALRRLELYGMDSRDVVDLSGLAPCTALSRLVLRGCGAETLGALACCATLRHVDLAGCLALVDLGGMASSGATLEHLDVQCCAALASLAPLTACTALRHLDAGNTRVADVAPLAACTALRRLSLGRTAVADVAPLAACTALRHLDLVYCDRLAAGFGALAACTALRVLRVVTCDALTDLRFLEGLTALEELWAVDCRRVADVGPATACHALRVLRLGCCVRLTDVRALASCTALEQLDLHYTGVTCIRALASCTRLKGLSLGGRHRGPDLAPLDLAPLDACTALESLTLMGARSDADVARFRARHGGCDLHAY
jgi:hypothetical protein